MQPNFVNRQFPLSSQHLRPQHHASINYESKVPLDISMSMLSIPSYACFCNANCNFFSVLLQISVPFGYIYFLVYAAALKPLYLSPPIKMIAISLKDEIETMLKKEGQSNSHWSCAGHQISIFPPKKMAFSAQFCCANPEYQTVS